MAALRIEHMVYQDTLSKVRASSVTPGGQLNVYKEIKESSKAQKQNCINTGGHRAWVRFLCANYLTVKGMNLTYIPLIIKEGEVMVQLEGEDISKRNTIWKKALIMYVVGNMPMIGAVERFIAAQWQFVQKPRVYLHAERYFVVKFSSVAERDEVFVSGPYTLASRPIILKAWTNEFNLHEKVLKTIPLWVKLPTLPLNYWSNKALRLGVHWEIPFTQMLSLKNVEKISYARLLVEIDVMRPLPGSVKVCDTEGKVLHQIVLYE
ncbi:hypothetical protein P3L10_030775 [Capsicum annuum]|uniref:uncharacterized protein LOC107846584 n=1 Tax=Capsicum annuum TaxID=4072 RepID=UPI001FB18C57|nr:uncharacterized protein LOC107846584 [Capsicum annuum]